MALTIVEYLRSVNPNIGLVMNPDGSYRIGVEDVNSDEILAALLGAIPAGANVIGSVHSMPERFEFVLHPFGKGSLTTDGVQYSAEVAGIGDTYTAIEVVTINQPVGYALQEIEFGLTVAIKSSAAVEGVNWKMQASDAGVLWQDLIAEQLRAASCAAYLDVSALGRFAPAGNFIGTGATFQVRAVVKSAVAAGETATGKMKSSSYVIVKYRRT
uniref:Uncharacterized protein n=1 Tax=viral metagenome TaxID=1070528 RepID=A0A6M3IWN0_9ZZZZ